MDVTSISQVLNILQNYQTIRFLQFAPATFMVYDCALYLDDEINYVWKKRLSSISAAYLIFRYLGIVYIIIRFEYNLHKQVVCGFTFLCSATHDFLLPVQPKKTNSFANAFPILAMCMNCVSVWFVQVILGLRLYALYNGSRRVLLAIGIGFIAECVIMIVCVTLLSLPSDRRVLDVGSNISASPSAARKVYVNYGVIVVYEIILFSLALSAAVRRYREKPGPSPVNRSGAKRLADILIEGNIVYFLANTLYAILYFVVSLTLPSEWLFGILTVGFALTSTIGCRLILHIRSAAPHSSTSPDCTDDEARLVAQPWPSKVHSSSSRA